MTSAEVLAAVRNELRESAASNWADAEIALWQAQILRQMADKDPLLKRANLAIIEYTKDVDVSALTWRNIEGVEYPVGNGYAPPIWRSYDLFGSNLVLDIETVPTITDGTLTGTVTFTVSSRSVTGSSTLFLTELEAGDLICKAAGTKYYQVAEVVSNTALTLVEPFEETSGADTVDSTKYRDYLSCARIHYGGSYTVSTTSDLPLKYDETLICGIVGYAATEYASNYIQIKMADITTKLASASTTLSGTGKAIDQIVLAVADLETHRGNVSDMVTAFGTAIADTEAMLDAVTTDLASGRALIDSINQGGDVAGKYARYGEINTEAAKARIEHAKSYMDKSKVNESYLANVTQELGAASNYIGTAKSYVDQAEQSANSGVLVRSYQGWANMKYAEYQDNLKKMGRVKIKYNCSRG